MRLDHDYPPSLCDIAHPGSFTYEVVYLGIPGFTFEMCKSGVLTPEIEAKFVETIKTFDKKLGCDAITSSCGF